MTARARFYKLDNPKDLVCRLYLDLKKIEHLEKARPDLILIMLNPGSCSPKDHNCTGETEVALDQTLRRVAKLFKKIPSINWIRILNLSDLANPKSDEFFKKLKELENSNIFNHSIFDKSRESDFVNLVSENCNIYFACGTSKKAQPMLEKAIDRLNERKAQILKQYRQQILPSISTTNKWC
jgi:hypothetical protein